MAEKIMTFYSGEDKYSDGDIESEILEYVKNTPESELEKIFSKDDRWPVYYHLSPIRQNIVNWYDIKPDSSVLEIGAGMGAITGILCQKAKRVTAVELSDRRAQTIYERHKHYDNLKIIVGNLNDITFEEKFDYITLIGVLEYAKMFTEGKNPYQTFINNIKKLLKPDGKLIIAIENKYGLKYFCGASEDHTGKAFDGINGYNDNSNVMTFDKNSLEKMLVNSGLKNFRFYYPEPDYKLPNYIFTDKSFPSNNITSKIHHYYQPGSFLIADEKKILDDVINNQVYSFFANSFLVEASETAIDEKQNPNLVVFNNERKPEYRLITAVYDDVVYKIPQNKKAIPHLYTIMENTKELKARGIKVIENTLEDGRISLPFVKEKTFDKVIIDLILEDKIDEAKKLVSEFNKEILKSSDKTSHNILIENKIVDENCKLDFGPILKKGYVDMTFFNCFYINGEFVFMDQEWAQYDVPAEYVIFRSFYCIWLQCKEISEKFNAKDFIKMFNINTDILDIGIQLNENLYNDVLCYFNVGPLFPYLSPVGKFKQNYEDVLYQARENLEKQNLELNQARENLEKQNSELNQARENLEKQNSELNQARENLEKQNLELNQARENLEKQNLELNQIKCSIELQMYEFKNLYNETINSACWRVMSPVRVVFNIIKRILKSNRITLLLYKFLVSLKNIGFRNTILKIKNQIKLKFLKNNVVDNYSSKNVLNDSHIISDDEKSEAFVYYLKHKSPYYVDYDENKETIISKDDVKLIAFYLPQFHTFEENDKWWGRGFTEWTNVTKCYPKFIGHYQPQLPIDVGFYDLSNVDVMRRQVKLAKQYGISGFCFHYYWFSGKRLMEKPLDNFLNHKDLDLKFCICWANENWTRRWDGQEQDVLIAQKHSDEDDLACIKDIAKYMRDDRYIRVDEKPLIIIYRGDLLPNIKKTIGIWRKYCRECGIGDIHVVGAKTFNTINPIKDGFDMGVEFPPNHLMLEEKETCKIDEGFEFINYDMYEFLESKKYLQSDKFTYKTVFPSWDNSARRSNGSSVLHLEPFEYKRWLIDTMQFTNKTKPLNKIMFINAWNEWAEGAHLEPDRYYGYAYLEMTSQAIVEYKQKEPLVTIVAPSYNHEKFIEESLQSVANQTYKNKELIIIDDNSSDNTVSVIENILKQEKFKKSFTNIIFIKHIENKGAHNTINEGLKKANGQYLTVINTDDMYEPNRLNIMISQLKKNNALFAFSKTRVIDSFGNFKIDSTTQFFESAEDRIDIAGNITHALINMNIAISTGNMIFEKCVFNYLGGFRDFSYIHDWDFILRATLIKEPIFVKDTNYLYRVHGDNTFQKLQKQKEESYRQGITVLTNIKNQVNVGNFTNNNFKDIDWPL